MRFLIASTLLVSALVLASPATAGPKKVTGKIISFDCGDNCYLTIKPAKGDEINALCSIGACVPWFEKQQMPAKFVGKLIEVTVGIGKQFDGSGNDMGEYPEFTTAVLVKAPVKKKTTY